jgi:Flp pilus assembly protein TadD
MAIETFKKAAEIDPNDPTAHFNLGIAYYLTGDKSAAFEEYVTLKDIDKERADILRDIIMN